MRAPRKTSNAASQLRVEPGQLAGHELWLDGYNVLTILESALAGGIVLLCRDGCCRDIAGIHRRYRKVTETLPVLRMVGETAVGVGSELLPLVARQTGVEQRAPQGSHPRSRC